MRLCPWPRPVPRPPRHAAARDRHWRASPAAGRHRAEVEALVHADHGRPAVDVLALRCGKGEGRAAARLDAQRLRAAQPGHGIGPGACGIDHGAGTVDPSCGARVHRPWPSPSASRSAPDSSAPQRSRAPAPCRESPGAVRPRRCPWRPGHARHPPADSRPAGHQARAWRASIRSARSPSRRYMARASSSWPWPAVPM